MFKKVNAGMAAFLRFWWRQPLPTQQITPQEACDIQKKASCPILTNSEHACTPPYVLIAGALSAEKQPVFEAAVHYLCTIAEQEPRYKAEILEILDAYLQEHPDNLPRTTYLHQCISAFNLR